MQNFISFTITIYDIFLGGLDTTSWKLIEDSFKDSYEDSFEDSFEDPVDVL